MTTLTYFSNFSVCDFFHFLLSNTSQKYQLIIFLIMLFINYQGLSRPLLGATIAPNLVPSVLKKKKKFHQKWLKKTPIWGVQANNIPYFSKNVPQKTHTCLYVQTRPCLQNDMGFSTDYIPLCIGISKNDHEYSKKICHQQTDFNVYIFQAQTHETLTSIIIFGGKKIQGGTQERNTLK